MYILSYLNASYEQTFVREVANQLTPTIVRSLAKSFEGKTDKQALAKANKYLKGKADLAWLKVKPYKYNPNLTDFENDFNNRRY